MSQSINQSKRLFYSGTAKFPSKEAMDQALVDMRRECTEADVRETGFCYLGNSIEFRMLDMKQLTRMAEHSKKNGGELRSFSTDNDDWRQSATIEFKSLGRFEEFMDETAKMGLWVVDLWLDEDARTVHVNDASLTEIEHLKEVAERNRGTVILDDVYRRKEAQTQKMRA